MQMKSMSFEFCLICILLSVMFSFGTFFILRLQAKSIEVFLPSPKSILSLISKKHSQIFVKSLFETRQEPSAYRNRFDLTDLTCHSRT